MSAMNDYTYRGASRMSSAIVWAAVLVSLLLLSSVGGAQGSAQSYGTASAPIVGTLPNGLRYYIKSNPHPAQRAYLWLAVNAGSVDEDNDQRGFAHFLEHMAFNGTRTFPANVLIDEVEKAGMRFGADLNAHTSFDETVYKLTMPTDDTAMLQRGLQIVYDWASGGILNDSLAVVGERGVVLGEWRMRGGGDTASKRVQREQFEQIFGKRSPYVDRLPIGDPALLETAERGPIDRFYHDWYRPDLMAIVIVGDFDAREMAQIVTTKFGAIPKPDKRRPFNRAVDPIHAQTKIHMVKERIRPLADLTWLVPEVPSDPKRAMRQQLVEQLTLQYLNKVAGAMANRDTGRVLAAAAVGRTNGIVRALPEVYQIRMIAHPDSLLRGFSALIGEVERVSQHGMPEDALEKAKAELLRKYAEIADGSATVQSQTIVNAYVEHFLDGATRHIWAPQDALALVTEILPTITSKDIATFAALWRQERGRVVTMHLSKPWPVSFLTDSMVTRMLDSVTTQKMVAASPYLTPGVGTGVIANDATNDVTNVGSIVGSKTIAEGLMEMTLSNGARVLVKATTNNPDEVLLYAYSPGGHSLLPDSLFFSPARLVAFLLTSVGGIGGKSHQELGDDLSAVGIRDFQLQLNAFDERMMMRGTPRDLEAMFQMMHTQFTNPTVDSAALDEWRRIGAQTLKISDNDILATRLGQNPRLTVDKNVVARAAFLDLDQAMRVYHNRFGDASDFTFYVIGAVDTQAVRPLLERYIASLPSTNRSTHETARSFGVKPPHNKSSFSMIHPSFPGERAQMSLQFWGDVKGTSASDQRDQRWKLRALSSILSRRLRLRLREEMAVTYSVGAPVSFYYTPESRYYISVGLLTAPDVIDSSTAAVWDEIKKLKTQGPTDEEVRVTHTILRRQIENAQQSNLWWASELIGFKQNGLAWEERLKDLPFTAEDIRTAAIQYLPDDIYKEEVYKPSKKAIEKAEQEKKERAEKLVK